MSKPRSFRELATKEHDMEITIANRRDKLSSSYEFKKDKGEAKKGSKPSKGSTKETMVTFVEEPVRISGKPRLEEKKGSSSRDGLRKRPMLKELQEKKYPFLTRTCQECWMVCLRTGSLSTLHQSDLKRLEGLMIQSTIVTIGSLAILLRNA